MAAIVEHPVGVYIGQRHEAYLADVGIGHGGLRLLNQNASEWWWQSHYNPLRPAEKETAAFNRGTALHVAFLETLKAYEKRYGRMPSKATHPQALDTVRELVFWLAKRKLNTAYTVKEDLIQRILQQKNPPQILEVEQAKFRKSGKLHVAEDVDFVIRLLHRQAMMSRQELGLPTGALTVKQALQGGLSEVGVYWVDENGIRQRARFDKLKPMVSLDLKSLTDWAQKGDFKRSLLREIVFRGYWLQAAHYDEARRQLRIAVDEGRVFGGTKTQRKRLGEIAASDEWAWAWIFAKMDGAPQVRAILALADEEKLIDGVIDRGLHYNAAVQVRENALANYLLFREMYGLEQAWLDTETVWTPEHDDWPPVFDTY